MKRKYGYVKDKDDSRDFSYKVVREGAPLPASVDLRPLCPPVYDQGQIGSCFSGSTMIPLLNGEIKTLKELYQQKDIFWVYSIDTNGRIVPGKAKCNLTGLNKEVINITLDNGEIIVCTPDHEFMLRDGTFKKCKNLSLTDSLMPLYRKFDKKGYELTFSCDDNKYHKTHNLVAFNQHLAEREKIQEKVKCVHHIDFNKLNNSPDNLKFMGLMDHWNYHASLSGFPTWNGTPEQAEHSRRKIIKQYKDNPLWNEGAASKGGKRAQENTKKDPILRERIFSGFKLGHNKENREKAAKSIRLFYQNNPDACIERSIRSKEMWKRILLNDDFKEKTHLIGVNLGKNSCKNKIVIWAKEILSEYGVLNEETWNLKKSSCGIHNFCKYQSIFKYFTIDELKDAAIHYNHKIVKIEFLNETSDVFCLEVEEHHNFALQAGIFVHNCTGNSIAGAIQFERMKQAEPNFVPSRLFIYYNERLMEGTVSEDAGAQIRDGIKSVVSQGVCPEPMWPYSDADFPVKPPQPCYDVAVKNLVMQYNRLNNQDIVQLKTSLAQGYPFVFGFQVFSAFESELVGSTGVLNMPQPGETNMGGHAVMCVGYDDAKQVFWIRNSWSSSWGQAGYFTMPYAYMTNPNLCNDFWNIQKTE